MADVVRELLTTPMATDKLGRRGIAVAEAQQVVKNEPRIVRNAGRRRRNVSELRARRTMVGCTHGGRALTIVIERTIDPTTWMIVTGWVSTNRERKMLRR